MYEALMRIIWKGFQVWIESNHPDKGPQIRSTDLKIRSIKEDVCHETLAAALDDDSCVQSFDMFAKYLHFLRTKHGDLARFWMMYIDMVEILLGLIRADREGDWMLHLACVRRVIPWCFAMNKVNYARYLPVYYAQMTQLHETCPELYKYCSCILNGLKCTVVCKLQGCSNMVQDDAIVAQDANDSDGDSDD
ncbi:hypothetical protein GWK47_029953 [Chionoecetes opilio]|uniref:Uncharacterized protein n=1 Tax=Chionoecetes opilio TaxID=41210 RepID=A0A8J4YKC6_CHIOP|nr:hypothetical protein GWK47_029953 [Chionoecetes opilio]